MPKPQWDGTEEPAITISIKSTTENVEYALRNLNQCCTAVMSNAFSNNLHFKTNKPFMYIIEFQISVVAAQSLLVSKIDGK